MCRNCFELCVFQPFPIRLHLDPLYLDSLTAPLELAGPVPSLIHTFKYSSVKPLAAVFAKILFLTSTLPTFEVISAVPLHTSRQDERGFNQAEELARQLAGLCHQPYQPLLVRHRATSSQAKLKHRADRLSHLATCFKPIPQPGTIPKTVLLVDDVATTGTTLNECAKLLKELGVEKVHGLVIAHGS